MKFDLDLFLLPNYCVLLFFNNMKYIYLSTMSTIALVMKKIDSICTYIRMQLDRANRMALN